MKMLIEKNPMGGLSYSELVDALEQDKKVCGKDYKLHFKDKRVEYVCINPQMNRTLAILDDDTVENYTIDFLDIYWGKYKIYEKPKGPVTGIAPTRMTLKEIEEILKIKIELVSEK